MERQSPFHILLAVSCLLLLTPCAALHSPKQLWRDASEKSLYNTGVPNGRWWYGSGVPLENTERIGQASPNSQQTL
eukprot:scaffold646173_cov29-Prasinocladus_malaysianus.AAC.1